MFVVHDDDRDPKDDGGWSCLLDFGALPTLRALDLPRSCQEREHEAERLLPLHGILLHGTWYSSDRSSLPAMIPLSHDWFSSVQFSSNRSLCGRDVVIHIQIKYTLVAVVTIDVPDLDNLRSARARVMGTMSFIDPHYGTTVTT